MFEFLKIQFKLGKIGEHELQQTVQLKWLTEDQMNEIVNSI